MLWGVEKIAEKSKSNFRDQPEHNRPHVGTNRMEAGPLFAELALVLDSENFRRSPALSELLNYLAKKALDADAEQVTEYSIAFDLLSRDSAFDPKIDPVVRVRVKRLRDALAKHYSDNTKHTHISIPPGGYDLKLVSTSPPPRKWLALGAMLSVLVILVSMLVFRSTTPEVERSSYPLVEILPFQNLTGLSENQIFEEGVQRQIASDLQRFGRLRVFQASPNQTSNLSPDYKLSGSVLGLDEIVDLSFRLERVTDQKIVYGSRLKGTILDKNYFQTIADITREVSGAIASRRGPLGEPSDYGNSGRPRLYANGGVSTTAFECVMLENRFFDDYDPLILEEGLRCFEGIINEVQGDPIAQTSLGNLMYHSVPAFDLMDTAALPSKLRSDSATVLKMAERTVREFPHSPDAFLFLGSIQNSMGERVASEVSVRQSIELNPGNPVAHAVLAFLALSDDRPKEALESSEEALKLSARPQGYMYFPHVLAALVLDDKDTAISAGKAYGELRSGPPSEFLGLIVARLEDDQPLADSLMVALQQRDDPFEGYKQFIQSQQVINALSDIVPELLASASKAP